MSSAMAVTGNKAMTARHKHWQSRVEKSVDMLDAMIPVDEAVEFRGDLLPSCAASKASNR